VVLLKKIILRKERRTIAESKCYCHAESLVWFHKSLIHVIRMWKDSLCSGFLLFATICISQSHTHTHTHTHKVYTFALILFTMWEQRKSYYILVMWFFFTNTVLIPLQIFDTGITVIDMMKRKPRQPEMHKKDHGLHFNDICSTVIGIWITCSPLNLNINCMHLLRRRWKKCSNIICLGLR